jgi:hypothetical protein
MATLKSDIDITALNDGRTYKLLEPLISNEVVVPTGFITDFASVPRLFWNIVPPNGKYRNAAIIHDYMYVYGIGGLKKVADDLFLQNMKILGVPWWKRIIMYRAVRFFGRGNY